MKATKEEQEAVTRAKMKGEQARTLSNIAVETEEPGMAFWLSFAGDDGFHGAVIVHANDFLEAVMRCNLRGINPHGECAGMDISAEDAAKIAPEWKNRVLSKEDCIQFDKEMQEKHPR